MPTKPRDQTRDERAPGTDGLRAVAALSIVTYHCWLYSSPDQHPVQFGPLSALLPHLVLGTTLFLTLSAFLLYLPYGSAILRSTALPDTRRHLRNRALRIFPAYWVILIATGVVLEAALLRDSSLRLRTGSLADDPILLIQNLLLLQNFAPHSLLTGIGPAWYLGVVLVFYLILPGLSRIAWELRQRIHSPHAARLAALLPALILLLVGFSGKALAEYVIVPGSGPSPGWDADWNSVLERSFLVQADRLAFGMTLAVVWVEARAGRIWLPTWWWKACTVGLLGVALPTMVLYDREVISLHAYATLMALAVALLFALVVLPTPGRARPLLIARLLENRWVAAVGLISYSLFLWHEPLVRWMAAEDLTLPGRLGFAFNLVLLALVAGGLSVLTYRLVELPALRYKARGSSRDREREMPIPVEQQAAP